MSFSQQNTNIEFTILRNIFRKENFARKVIPYLKDEYFKGKVEKVIFKTFESMLEQYNALPSFESIGIRVKDSNELSDREFGELGVRLHELKSHSEEPFSIEWLVGETETFCKERALYNAILKSIEILEETEKDEFKSKESRNGIPEMVQKALSITFDQSLGHEWAANAEERYDFYQQTEERIPFPWRMLNAITNGGIVRKSLTVPIAGTGVGKSLMMCDYAAFCLKNNIDALYITCEMSQERIAERIDANLLDCEINNVGRMDRTSFMRKIRNLESGTRAKLVIKEYPTASAHAGHFRHFMNELRLKKNFLPKILFVDYLNICASSRYKGGANVNSYNYCKSIAEELRGLGMEKNVAVISPTQVNRGGFGSSDVELTDISDSFGVAYTADLGFAMMSNEELDNSNRVLIKQLKNRYNDLNRHRRFYLGIEKPKMRLFDVPDDEVPSGVGREEVETEENRGETFFYGGGGGNTGNDRARSERGNLIV